MIRAVPAQPESAVAELEAALRGDLMPQHVAVIMDGNGRWGKLHGMERLEGHHEAIKAVRATVTAAQDLKLPFLTLYCFSTENLNRPADEIHGLFELFMAVLEGRAELVKQLLSMGAKPNPAGKERAPLVAAALRNRPREAKLLLEAGAKPQRALDPDGDPVLVTAAFREATPVVRALLKVPHPREHLSLALLEAAGVGNLPITKLLVKHGADPEWVSKRGNSAISVARKKRRRDVVAYLQSLQKK